MRYGDAYHTIDINDDVVVKYTKLEEVDLRCEKLFYRTCTHLKMPKVIQWDPFTLERIRGRHASYDDYDEIIKQLSHMHQSTTTLEVATDDIRYEIYDKLVQRYKPCPMKEYINGVKIKTYEQALYFMKHVDIPLKYKCMIHGDPHFENIMVNEDGLYFIDPRGYFGKTDLYGVAEYDIAKVHFALSGYNAFEHMNSYKFDDVIDIQIHEKAFSLDFFTHVLLCSIWLGNSHVYQGEKFVMSRHFALYIFTLFCLKYKIDIEKDDSHSRCIRTTR